jgi:hypothetical protein
MIPGGIGSVICILLTDWNSSWIKSGITERSLIVAVISQINFCPRSTPNERGLGGFVDSLEYVVTMGFGTPSVPQVLLMDTGSSFASCNSTTCYPQKDPLFDPSRSSTYAPIA